MLLTKEELSEIASELLKEEAEQAEIAKYKRAMEEILESYRDKDGNYDYPYETEEDKEKAEMLEQYRLHRDENQILENWIGDYQPPLAERVYDKAMNRPPTKEERSVQRIFFFCFFIVFTLAGILIGQHWKPALYSAAEGIILGTGAYYFARMFFRPRGPSLGLASLSFVALLLGAIVGWAWYLDNQKHPFLSPTDSTPQAQQSLESFFSSLGFDFGGAGVAILIGVCTMIYLGMMWLLYRIEYRNPKHINRWIALAKVAIEKAKNVSLAGLPIKNFAVLFFVAFVVLIPAWTLYELIPRQNVGVRTVQVENVNSGSNNVDPLFDTLVLYYCGYVVVGIFFWIVLIARIYTRNKRLNRIDNKFWGNAAAQWLMALTLSIIISIILYRASLTMPGVWLLVNATSLNNPFLVYFLLSIWLPIPIMTLLNLRAILPNFGGLLGENTDSK